MLAYYANRIQRDSARREPNSSQPSEVLAENRGGSVEANRDQAQRIKFAMFGPKLGLMNMSALSAEDWSPEEQASADIIK